jgi:streptomycin 6-kinase
VDTFPIPDLVRRRAEAEGMSGWVDRLPELVAQLSDDWSLSPGAVLSGGSEALVIDVTRSDGTAAVLKLLMPHRQADAVNEIQALEIAAGSGCAVLFRSDAARGAMLMERLGEPLERAEPSESRRLDILVALARDLWRPAPGYRLPSGAAKAAWLADFIETEWEALDRPCSEAAARCARDAALRREGAHRDAAAVFVHGDIHAMNALASATGGYKLIDPDGVLAEPECDIGVILRAYPPTRVDAEARRIASFAGLDAAAIIDWATAERLSSAFVCRAAGYEPFGSQLIEAAELAVR